MAIEFDRPWGLSLALIALVWWFYRRRRRARRGRGGLIGPTLQAIALVLLAGAVARARWFTRSEGTVAVFVDVSASQRGLSDTVDLGLGPRWQVHSFKFADGVGGPGEMLGDTATLLDPVMSIVGAYGDRWDAAVVLTDGHFTDAVAELSDRSAASGPELFFVPRAPEAPDARIADVTAAVEPDGRVRLSATVVANAPMERTLRITRGGDDEPILTETIALPAGAPVTVEAWDSLRTDGPASYEATLSGGDLLDGNNRLSVAVGASQPALLWIGSAAAIEPVAPPGWTVHRTTAAKAPAHVDGLLGYAAIALVDATGRGLSGDQRSAVAHYVHLGGGLLLIGAGPYDTIDDLTDPINQIAPLVVAPHRRRPLDVVVLLDASSSMAEPATGAAHQRKFDLVRQAVMAMAREQLAAADRLQVITFTSRPIHRFDKPATEQNLDVLAQILTDVRPVGGTRVTGALHIAWKSPPASGKDRLVVVLSDMETQAFKPTLWAQRFSAAGMSLAVVAVGERNRDAPLAQLAAQTAGQFELREDLTGLAEVFIQLVRRARGDAVIRRSTPVKITADVFATGVTSLPPIDTHLATTLQPGAELLVATGDDEPLIARRRSETGRVVASAVPLEAPQNMLWREAASVRSLLAGAVRWVRMPDGDPRFDGTLHRDTPTATLVVTAFDDEPINHLELDASWSMAAGEVAQTQMIQIGPGRYEAPMPVPVDAATVVTVRQRGDEPVLWRKCFTSRYPRELARTGVNAEALRTLAQHTDGQVVDAGDVAAHLQALRNTRGVDLWPWLLAAALALALVEWLVAGRSGCGN